MYKKTTLPSGLRFITQNLENTKSVTVLILAGAGSRYETRRINGIAHFLEHMFFKGAEKYKNTQEVSEAIDNVGGDFNAFTGKEYVGYYVKVADRHIDVALDVLADMLIHSRFDPEEIDRERGVIMEEYNMYQDTPMHQIGWDFEKLIYGDQPMGWDQVGTKEVIHSLTQKDFIEYKTQLYTPDNIVIAIAGHVDHDSVLQKIEKLFVFEQRKKAFQPYSVEKNHLKNNIYVRPKKTEQGHILLGFPGYPEIHPDYFSARLLSIILGGNMSSRMFLSVRERQGLAYYIHTSIDSYTDTGTFSTNAGVSLEGIDKAIQAIIHEYTNVLHEPVPGSELKKAKEFFKGKLALRLEDSEEYAHLLGKYELLYKKLMTPEEIAESVDHVQSEDIQRVAQNLFHEDRMYLSVIGPYKEHRFAPFLKF